MCGLVRCSWPSRILWLCHQWNILMTYIVTSAWITNIVIICYKAIYAMLKLDGLFSTHELPQRHATINTSWESHWTKWRVWKASHVLMTLESKSMNDPLVFHSGSIYIPFLSLCISMNPHESDVAHKEQHIKWWCLKTSFTIWWFPKHKGIPQIIHFETSMLINYQLNMSAYHQLTLYYTVDSIDIHWWGYLYWYNYWFTILMIYGILDSEFPMIYSCITVSLDYEL